MTARTRLLSAVIGSLLATLALGASQAAAARLTLVSVHADHASDAFSPTWSYADDPGGNAAWNTPSGNATYAFPIPYDIPADEPSTFTATVTSVAAENSRWAPALIVKGDIVAGGEVGVGSLSEPGQSTSASKTITLNPRGATSATVTIRLQDGPTFTYVYKVEGPKPSPCKLRARRAAVNEVRIVKIVGGVNYHPENCSDPNAWIPLTKDVVLHQGDELQCDPDGVVTLAFADNATVEVFDTTQLKIASFFTEGGVVRTEILLAMGRVAATVNKSEATKSDFRIKAPSGQAGVRGTRFSVFVDPFTKATIVSTTEGTVEWTPSRSSLRPVLVPAGRELEATPSSVGKLAGIGKAGARGGVNRRVARDRVLKLVARGLAACRATVPRGDSVAVLSAAQGWKVSVLLEGGLRGTATWRVKRGKVSAANGVAKKLLRGCR